MYGPKKPQKGKCNATIEFGDDYGDNCTTFRCNLKKGHKGKHQEKGDMGWDDTTQPYTVEWEDEKKL